MLAQIGLSAVSVRTPQELSKVDGLVLPGGESTAISKLLVIFEMMQPVRQFLRDKPVLATCAGLILASDEVVGRLPDQELIGGLDIVASRNAYGSQADSFEADVQYADRSERVAFIRAPRIVNPKDATVLSRYQGEPVAVQQGRIIAAAYHPELTGSTHLHSLFKAEVEKSIKAVI